MSDGITNADNTANEEDNEHTPPSSAEEAAALIASILSSPFLDTSISFDTSKTKNAVPHPNPPQGMHSIFTVQTPLPNQALFVRLVNLRAWLRWHADALDDSSDGFNYGVGHFLHSCAHLRLVSNESHAHLERKYRISLFPSAAIFSPPISIWEYHSQTPKESYRKNHSSPHVLSWLS